MPITDRRYWWTAERWQREEALRENWDFKPDDMPYFVVELPPIPDRQWEEFKRFLEERSFNVE